MTVVSDREYLMTKREILDRGEAAWLLRLATFNLECGWAADGQNSCVEWLMHWLHMARSTAFEKVQVARALHYRRALATAFQEGRISYSAARIMARMPDPSGDVDEVVLQVAENCPIRDVERVVSSYFAYLDQERPPRHQIQPSVRVSPYAPGYVKVESILPETDAEEVLAALRLFATPTARRQSAAADELDDETLDEEDPESPESVGASIPAEIVPAEVHGTGPAGESAAADPLPAPTVLAAALMDMTRAAAAHTGKAAVAADRCLMHVIVDHNGITTLPDGTRIADNEAARLACDCSIVVHHYKDGQPLYQSRRTRKWNTAQRRAALVRDGGHCRFPGCEHRIVDLHHHQDWDHDGKTDIDNGYNLCRRHHRLIHSGFQAHGQPDGQLRFYRPDRTPIGATAPVDRDTISFSTMGRIE